jgi:hypothetical protein
MGCPTGGSAKPATGETFAPCAGQRRPAVRVRVETGLWRAVLRMREGCLAQCQPPWRSRIVNARPSPCRTMPPVAQGCPCPGGEQAARDRLSDADTIRRSSGRARAAPSPHVPAKAGHAHQPHFRTAQPARGPPDCPCQNSGVAARGGFSCGRCPAEPDRPFRRYSLSSPPYTRRTVCCLRCLPFALATRAPAVAPVLQPKFPSGDPL